MPPSIPLKPDPSLLRTASRRSLTRAICALALGSAERGNVHKGALEVLQRNYKFDDNANRIFKAGTAA